MRDDIGGARGRVAGSPESQGEPSQAAGGDRLRREQDQRRRDPSGVRACRVRADPNLTGRTSQEGDNHLKKTSGQAQGEPCVDKACSQDCPWSLWLIDAHTEQSPGAQLSVAHKGCQGNRRGGHHQQSPPEGPPPPDPPRGPPRTQLSARDLPFGPPPHTRKKEKELCERA